MLKNRRRQNGNWNLWEKKRNKFKELRKVTVNEGNMWVRTKLCRGKNVTPNSSLNPSEMFKKG